MAEMHHYKLSPTICDYEQLISIDYKYNQFDIDEIMSRGHLLENSFSIININRSQISSQLTLNGSNHSHFRLNWFQIYSN